MSAWEAGRYVASSNSTVSWQGFMWNGTYHRLEDGDDPEPNAGVREPRRPLQPHGAGSMTLDPMEAMQ